MGRLIHVRTVGSIVMALEEQLVDGHGDNRNAGKGIEDGKDDKSDKTYYVLVTGTNR